MSDNLFLVGPNQAYPQVQDAIDELVSQQGPIPFTEEKEILIAERGTYEPFRIPTDSLRPEPAFRLIVGSASGVLAVISGDTPEQEGVANTSGCLIGSNIPNVTIRKLFFKNSVKGITASVNCHNLIVEKCILINHSNTGIWVYQSDNAQIFNNIILNAKFGIATTLARNVAVIFNTVFNEPDFTDADSACVYIELQRDRTHGIEDHGTATLFNNILFSIMGNCIMLNERDISNLQSDFNDIYTQSGNIAKIRVELPNSGVNLININTLEQWRQATNWDTVSISEHPAFIQQNQEFGGSFIDLNLLPTSPCIQAAKLLCGDPTNDLPAYIDDSLLCTDILDKARASQPTIGANEVAVQEGYYGLSIFTTIVPEEQAELVCGDQYSSLDLAVSQYASAVDCWYPQIKSGYFYIREKPYYLYSDKAAYTLRHCTRTRFVLARALSKSNISIYVSGKQVTDTKYWRLDGNELIINHLDLEIDSLNDEVLVDGIFKEWDSTTQKFRDKVVSHRFRLRDGQQTYWLPSNPLDSAPIVITDDTVTPLDNTGLLPVEFKTSWDATLEQTQLLFSPSQNMIENPQFEYGVPLIDELDQLNIDAGDFTTRSNPIRRYQDDTGQRPKLARALSTKANEKQEFRITDSFLSRLVDSGAGISMVHHGYELPEDYETVTDGRIALRTAVKAGDNRTVRPLMGRQFLVFDVPTGDTGVHFVSQDIKVDPDQSYIFTTYLCAPNATGEAIVSLEFLDHNGVLLNSGGPFTYQAVTAAITGGTDEYWTRVALSIGNTPEATPGIDAIGLSLVDTGLVPINSGAERMIIKLSAETGAPVAYDCLQLETNTRPSPYGRIPRGSDVTIEYESNDSGFYTIEDLTVAPIRNPRHNGFLQVPPVSAGQFDTGSPINTTTLSDWFWPTGRLTYLPWAKTDGMNKWERTSHFHSGYQGITNDEFTWDLSMVPAENIGITPLSIISTQGSDGDIFTISIRDADDNPYAFNPVQVEIMENRAEFPGWLAFREFGLPTQLGQRIKANSNSDGTLSVLFYPPSSEDIEYRGDRPSTLTAAALTGLPQNTRNYGFIETNYKVSRANYGNITVHDQFMNMISIRDTNTTTGILSPRTDSYGNSHYLLGDFPVFGTLKVFNDNTGTFDRELEWSLSTDVDFGQFFFDEESTQLTIKGLTAGDIRVEYNRLLAWIKPEYLRRIYIDESVLDQVTGDIIINYDAEVKMKITAEAPPRTAGLPAKFMETVVVAQNKYIGQDN